MALEARALIEAARDRHPAFSRERNPDALLLRHLSREQRRLMGKVAQVNPQAVASVEEITLATYDFDTGHALPAHQGLDPRGEVVYTDTDRPLTPLMIRAIEDRPIAGSGFFAGERSGTLYLFGTADDWEDIATVRIGYTPLPSALVTLSATLVLPDASESCLVTGLAALMGGRGHVDHALPPIDTRGFQAEAAQAEADFIREMRSSYRAVSFRIREVC